MISDSIEFQEVLLLVDLFASLGFRKKPSTPAGHEQEKRNADIHCPTWRLSSFHIIQVALSRVYLQRITEF